MFNLFFTVAEKGHSFPISVIAKVQYFHLQLWPFPNTVIAKVQYFHLQLWPFPNTVVSKHEIISIYNYGNFQILSSRNNNNNKHEIYNNNHYNKNKD